jgi:hypothetical protein
LKALFTGTNMSKIIVTTERKEDILDFLTNLDYLVKDLGDKLYSVERDGDFPVYLNIDSETLYFEVDLGSLKGLGSEALYFKLLECNTQILPVSFGINNTNPDDSRLVLVESRETVDLCDKEVLSVFDALSIASDKANTLLTEFIR